MGTGAPTDPKVMRGYDTTLLSNPGTLNRHPQGGMALTARSTRLDTQASRSIGSSFARSSIQVPVAYIEYTAALHFLEGASPQSP